MKMLDRKKYCLAKKKKLCKTNEHILIFYTRELCSYHITKYLHDDIY